jgi:hypothetical protein
MIEEEALAGAVLADYGQHGQSADPFVLVQEKSCRLFVQAKLVAGIEVKQVFWKCSRLQPLVPHINRTFKSANFLLMKNRKEQVRYGYEQQLAGIIHHLFNNGRSIEIDL